VDVVEFWETATERGRAAAVERGLDDRITWLALDLSGWRAGPEFDLVSAFFLQSPVELPRAQILRAAAAAVAPGGHLLLVSHAAPPPWASALHNHHADLPTPAGELAALQLPDEEWEVLVSEVRTRAATGPDGQPAELEDTVVLARRHP
jgi:hypothetical protein